MNSEDFSAGDWIDRLAKELQCLAEAQKPYLPERRDCRPRVQGPVGERESYVRAVALDDLRILYARARHNIGMGEEERYAPLRAVLDRARYILIAHPTLARVIGPIIDRDDFWVQILHAGSRTSPTGHCHVNRVGPQRPAWIPFQAAALAVSHTLNASFRNRLNVSLLHK